jgi:hypothetical protein
VPALQLSLEPRGIVRNVGASRHRILLWVNDFLTQGIELNGGLPATKGMKNPDGHRRLDVLGCENIVRGSINWQMVVPAADLEKVLIVSG